MKRESLNSGGQQFLRY